MHVPGRLARAVLVRSIAAPQALDQGGCGDLPTVHVLLPLLLLDLQSKTRPQNTSWEGKETDATNSTEGGHDLALPCDGDTVTVSNCAQRDHAPPEGVGKAGKVLVVVLLHHVDNEGGEDEDQEADVEGGDELLAVRVHHGAEELPGAAAPVHAHHPQDLEEPEAPERGGGVDAPAQAGEHDQRGTGDNNSRYQD